MGNSNALFRDTVDGVRNTFGNLRKTVEGQPQNKKQ